MCVADGHPTPTITWKKPNGSKLNEVTALENKADAEMITEQDFGSYTCEAKNVVGAAATRTVEIQQIRKGNISYVLIEEPMEPAPPKAT